MRVNYVKDRSCNVEACVADRIATRKERQERRVEPPRTHTRRVACFVVRKGRGGAFANTLFIQHKAVIR